MRWGDGTESGGERSSLLVQFKSCTFFFFHLLSSRHQPETGDGDGRGGGGGETSSSTHPPPPTSICGVCWKEEERDSPPPFPHLLLLPPSRALRASDFSQQGETTGSISGGVAPSSAAPHTPPHPCKARGKHELRGVERGRGRRGDYFPWLLQPGHLEKVRGEMRK